MKKTTIDKGRKLAVFRNNSVDNTYDEWSKIINEKFKETGNPQWSDMREVRY